MEIFINKFRNIVITHTCAYINAYHLTNLLKFIKFLNIEEKNKNYQSFFNNEKYKEFF